MTDRLQNHQIAAMTKHERLVAAGRANAADFVMPGPKVRRPRNNEESRMQQALLKWWAASCRGFGVPMECLFAIPNGMRKGAVIGSILKREGVRAGVPDLMLAVGRTWRPHATEFTHAKDCLGLFLELKTAQGVISAEQRQYHAILTAQGYRCVVVRSLDEAVKTITEYLTK